MFCFHVFKRTWLVIYQARFTYETVLGYLLHFPVVVWTFSTLYLCDSVVKAGSVTVTYPFSGLFWDRVSNLGVALEKQWYSAIWITLSWSQRPFILVKVEMALKMSKGELRQDFFSEECMKVCSCLQRVIGFLRKSNIWGLCFSWLAGLRKEFDA